jgi:Flp pilus assembly protein TadD
MRLHHVVRGLALVALSTALACGPRSSSKAPSQTAPENLVSKPPATSDVLRGERLLVNGRVTEAQSVFEQAIADDPEDARAWLDLGLTQEAKGDLASAERAYRRATDIDPRFAEAMNNLGVLLREGGNLQEAISVLERAVSLDSDLTAARFNLGLAYEDQGRFDDAEREYLATIEQLPGDPVPRINLAMMYLEAGRMEDAASQFRAARPMVRGDVLLSIAVGEGLRRAMAPEEAVAVLEDALRQAANPPPTDLLAELSLAYYAAGDLSSAEKSMRRAIGQDEIDPALQYAYGSILAKLGDVGKARFHLRRAISLAPNGPYAERARGRLESLK